MSSRPKDSSDVVVVVGNPAESSRTSLVARQVAARLVGADGAAPVVIELEELGAAVLDPDDETVRRAQQSVVEAGVLVVATPVYKAAYTGLLKVFLDRLSSTALDGAVVVPVVVSASGAHGAVADVGLRIVLQALGGLLPTPSLVIEEHHLDHLPEYVDAWHERFGRTVRALAESLTPEAVGA
jgi:FMN reductase